jgi:acetolactate synthase-1/2/3 large subunit
MPAMFITGQKPIKKSKQGRFQIVDTVELMRPVTKATKQIISGNVIPAMVRDMFRVADEERPGAVHLVLPEDVAAEETDEDLVLPSSPRRPVPEQKALAAAFSLIEDSKRPLILVGAAANRKLVARMLKVFMDKTGIPAFATQLGKGVVDERDTRFLGTAALSSGDFVHRAIAKADLIINVGHDVVEKPPFLMHRGGPKVIHINFTSAQVDEIYHPDHEVIGDIANALWELSEKVRPQSHWDFSVFTEIKRALDAHISSSKNNNRFPIIPQRIVHSVRRAVPESGIVTLDNGMYKLWFARNYPTYSPNTLLLDNALATMGAGLPSAIAAKQIFPDRPVVAVVGDGGFMMNSQELETAVRLKLNLVIVVLNDNGYGMIKWKQDSEEMESFGLDYGNPDFVKYAEAYGARGHRVTSADDFENALRSAITGTGVTLIEVPIDYSENVRVFTKELPEITGTL